MDLRNRICNLCLVKCENYKSIEGNMKTHLNILLPTIDFSVIREPVMCKSCEEMLWKYFAFKEKCLDSYDDSVINKGSVKFELKDMCLRKNTIVGVPEDHEICDFCKNLVKSCYAVSLEVDIGRVTLEKMMERCLPELDLSVIKYPIICTDCHKSLENCFRFVTNCLAAEEKIKKYFESLDVDSKSQVDLNNILHSIKRTVEASDINVDADDIMEAEKRSCVKTENPAEIEIGVIKLEQISYDDNEYVNIIGNKNESMSDSAEQNNMLGAVKIEETFCAENEIKPEDGNVGETDDQKCILNEDIEIKTDDRDFSSSLFPPHVLHPSSSPPTPPPPMEYFPQSFEESIIMKQARVNTSFNSRQKCWISKLKNELIKTDITQSLLKNDATKITTYQYESGLFQRKKAKCLKRHLLIHKTSSEVTMFKCDSCPYKSRWKSTLKKHLLKHMDPSEVTMFKCDSCPYQSRWKRNLKDHLLQHVDPSSGSILKCDSCPYQSRRKSNLKNHLLKHMNPSEVTMLKCYSCPFQSQYKCTLRKHLLTHMDLLEVIMFKCDSCPFEARRKDCLKNHIMLKHMDPSKVTMFKCDFCPYQARKKDVLKNHVVKHMDPSEIAMFKCGLCPFQTKKKDYLKKHMFKHMDPSEVTMFACDSCLFQTRWKDKLKSHAMKHMNPSEVTMFACDSCHYQARRKDYLKKHMLKHMDPSEVTMFTCKSCPFQTRRKDRLTSHALKHMDPSEVTMFTCGYCFYQTKYKGHFERHLKTHKASSG